MLKYFGLDVILTGTTQMAATPSVS